MKALKNQLTGAVDPKYLADLHNKHTGYNNSIMQQILDYLYQHYGELDESYLEEVDQ